MDFDLPPDDDPRRLEVRAWLEANPGPTPDELLDAGYTVPHWPAPWGVEADPMHQIVIDEELRRAGVRRPDNAIGIGWAAPTIQLAGTEEQKQKWLMPLIEGRMESGFSMTEPDQPGSDPRSLRTTARRDGDSWVVNGHKWFTSNGLAADFFIVMCRTDEGDGGGDRNSRMTQIIVPADSPGLEILRGISVWGRPSDHCEIVYENVRVPLENQLGETGQGHQAAQDRLGAGRVYHCMNSIGQMWRAFDLMVERAANRQVHGGLLESKQFVQGFIADSYMDIQASRLMTIHCAEKMQDGAFPRTDISAIKVFVPAAYQRVVDRAIQVWGAAGITDDLPLATMFQAARSLRIVDGPDEVHRILVAKNVLGACRGGGSWDFGN
ncbi:MAG: acyl-CoA dehydrogenase family protein [Acidimicrobiales bacterium]|nr:acyl-CoA dehydrogenase family protein [Acidimicrobiales bacterium]